MHRAFEHCTLGFLAIFNVLRQHINVLRNKISNTSMCCGNTFFLQSAARIPTRCQQPAPCRSTTALLSLLSFYNIYRYICTHVCVYIEEEGNRLQSAGAAGLAVGPSLVAVSA